MVFRLDLLEKLECKCFTKKKKGKKKYKVVLRYQQNKICIAPKFSTVSIN